MAGRAVTSSAVAPMTTSGVAVVAALAWFFVGVEQASVAS
jgi:hypothetical protein